MHFFYQESLFDITQHLRAALQNGSKVSFCVPNPDLGSHHFTGELLDSPALIHRSWRVWFELAERLECRFLTPTLQNEHHVCLRFEKLKPYSSPKQANNSEKYGLESDFSRINKLEESDFLLTYLEALERIKLKAGQSVLSLGVNSAKEFLAFTYLGLSQDLSFTGIDYSETALNKAKATFPQANYQFIQANINALDRLELAKFDLIMSLGTLQSPGIHDREVLRYLVQNCIDESSSLLFAFPNSTYVGTELSYGARMKNFYQPDLSLVIKDAAYYRKYLHQHKFKVFITGKNYLFITAIPA